MNLAATVVIFAEGRALTGYVMDPEPRALTGYVMDPDPAPRAAQPGPPLFSSQWRTEVADNTSKPQ
jgi:hypothetical protein